MELRHLRCFLAVAEELHFARAAGRLHIEPSPLSRAGKLFLEHVPRIFTALQQARDSVKAAANDFHGQLRIALSDGITPLRLPALLALCRQKEPEVDNVSDVQADKVAATKFAVDCQVEHGEVANCMLVLKMSADCPDVFQLEGWLLADEPPLVPGFPIVDASITDSLVIDRSLILRPKLRWQLSGKMSYE